ncbi:MAG: translation initiation factor IF-3 [Bdellovibrionota bacterium]
MSSNSRGGGRQKYEHEEQHRINNRITAREVRLITEDGEQIVVPIATALSKAEVEGLDLVEVAPNATPPVCKLMDYGKFKYREQKKEAEAKKKRSEQQIKEIRIRYRTDVGDLETKLKKARGFLADGDKVKFSMRFKGREIMYVDLGQAKLKEIIDALADVSEIDDKSPPRGRQIFIVLAPKKN